MSEVVESGGLTAGGLLREARQASGMHIAALAVALKVPVSKLEALEADNFTVLPDTVFVRALASSVLNEHSGFEHDVIERQLAHAEPNAVRRTYNHADYLADRAKMMQQWADTLDAWKKSEPGKVVPLRAAAA